MTKRAATTKAVLRRAIDCLFEGATRAGWPVGSFKIVVDGGKVEFLPIAANAPLDDAAEMERRIRGAFEE